MKKIKCTLLLGTLVIATILSGCGNSNFSNLKESSMCYSSTQNALLLKKIDGAPQLGTALEKSIPNGKWENEEKKYNGEKEEYIVYKGTLKADEMKAIKDNLDHHDQALNALRSTPIKDLPSRFDCDLDGNEYAIKFYFKEIDKDNFIPDSVEILGDEKAGYDKTSLDQNFILMEFLEKSNPEYDFTKDGIPLIYIPKALQETAEKIQKLQNADKVIGQIYQKQIRDVTGYLSSIVQNTVMDDKDYSNLKSEDQERLSDISKSIDAAAKNLSDIDPDNSPIKEMLMAIVDKEKELIDPAKDIIQKRNEFSLPKDKDSFKNSIRDSALKFNKTQKEINKMCVGGKITYNGVVYSSELNSEYKKWNRQNYNNIKDLQDQVWQQ